MFTLKNKKKTYHDSRPTYLFEISFQYCANRIVDSPLLLLCSRFYWLSSQSSLAHWIYKKRNASILD